MSSSQSIRSLEGDNSNEQLWEPYLLTKNAIRCQRREGLTTMRLFYLCIYALALAGPVPVMSVRPAFVGPYSPAIRLSASQLGSKAEEHLQEMAESWAELEQKEKEVVEHPDEVSSTDCIVRGYIVFSI